MSAVMTIMSDPFTGTTEFSMLLNVAPLLVGHTYMLFLEYVLGVFGFAA
jgi:hypothetical protein